MPKQIYFGSEAHKHILKGATLLAEAVRRTLGPRSGIVILQRSSGILPTKDGVTIARELQFDEPHLRLGCKLMADACLAVNKEVGDGTTTTACIALEMLTEGMKLLAAGKQPQEIVAGINASVDRACDMLDDLAIPADTEAILHSVALIASNGDTPIANALTKAAMAVGKDGEIIIEDGKGTGIEIELREGMVLNKGPSSIHQIGAWQDGVGFRRILEGALVAVVPKVLASFDDVRSILEEATQFPMNPIIIFATSIEGEAQATLLANDMKLYFKDNHKLNVVGVSKIGTALHRRGYLEDIAALAGATVVDGDLYNHKEFKPEWFGSVRKAEFTVNETVLTGYPDKRPFIDERLARLKQERDATPFQYDRAKLQERIGKLAGGIGFIRVGGITGSEAKERKARVEDALGALSAALEEGVGPGGGMSLVTVQENLEASGFQDGPFGDGQRITCKAILAPFQTIVRNAGKEPYSILDQMREARQGDAWIGWDAMTETIRDFGSGEMILDPIKVNKAALRAAASVVSTLIATDVAILKR